MMKRYAPFIVLLLAALSLFYIKNHQRGSSKKENLEIPVGAVSGNEGFTRNPVKIIYTKHATCRMECRHISEPEVREILQKGKLIADKIQEDERGKTYPLDGKTKSDKMIRIVVAPKKENIVVVTVIDLDKEWPCECDKH